MQASVNIGLVGHVDHGKTSIVKALTGKWTDTHSEELKRGITIRLGYADLMIRKCNCGKYTSTELCGKCKKKTEPCRMIAFVDAPGHETLMAVVISSSAIMDGAILVIAANEPCPQPQTYEHLMVLDICGVKNIIIAQSKLDVVSKEDALKHYQQIKAFVKGTIAENAPIIPIAAHQKINLDALLEAIEEYIPTPKRALEKASRMFIARSFDVNKPGSEIKSLVGGVVGGSIVQGKLRIGDIIEIKPGINRGNKWQEITTKIVSLTACNKSVKEAIAGGLVGVGTELDPSLTKSDSFVGNICGEKGTLPSVLYELILKVSMMGRIVGSEKVDPLRMNELFVVNVATATTIGQVISLKPVKMKLKRPVCAEKGWKVALNRRIGNRWRLMGYGTII